MEHNRTKNVMHRPHNVFAKNLWRGERSCADVAKLTSRKGIMHYDPNASWNQEKIHTMQWDPRKNWNADAFHRINPLDQVVGACK